MESKENIQFLENLITKRRTVHSYTEEQVPRNILLKAIELSLWAPNHHLTYPWKYVILESSQRSIISETVITSKNKKEPLNKIKQKALRDKFEKKGSLILCLRKTEPEQSLKAIEEDRATLACSIYIMSLYFESLSYSTKWGTGNFLRSEDFLKNMNLDKKNIEAVGLLYCGRPCGAIPKASERPQLQDVLLD